MKRRNFIKNASLTGVGFAVGTTLASCVEKPSEKKVSITKVSDNTKKSIPIVIATWKVQNTTETAWKVLEKGGNALDAVEQGCKIEEANKKIKPLEKAEDQTEMAM